MSIICPPPPPHTGSPVEMLVFDPNNIKVIWDAVRQVPVTKPVTFVLDPCGIPDAPVDATIIGQYSIQLP